MANDHRLSELAVIATCKCGRVAIADSEAAALARLDDHCESEAVALARLATQCAGQMTFDVEAVT
jgi:hypothetical protein